MNIIIIKDKNKLRELTKYPIKIIIIMFKKIEAWTLYLTVVCAIIITISFGALVRQELVGLQKFGFVSKTALFLAEIPMNLKQMYLNFTDKGTRLSIKDNIHADKPRFKRFITTDRNELLFLARYDGDIKRSVVEIVDLNNFLILHAYKPDVNEINSKTDTNREEFARLKIDDAPSRFEFRHPLLLNDGGILSQSDSPLFKIDFCSNLMWVNDVDMFHHSNEIDFEGNYWVPSEIFPYAIDAYLVGSEWGKFKDDSITKISPNGKILYQKSVTEILLENNYKHLIFGQSNFIMDPIHLNDIQPVLKDGIYWKKDDVFLSIKNMSLIMHFRPSTNEIINMITGPFFQQHDVDIISNKEISIFNNNRLKTIDGDKITNNEIVIYNFETQIFSKKFNEQLKAEKVATEGQGLSHILEDGSMMVEEQDQGRILFFNSNGELEWEYVNKAKNGMHYIVTWSRIIENENLIENIKEKIKNKQCTN